MRITIDETRSQSQQIKGETFKPVLFQAPARILEHFNLNDKQSLLMVEDAPPDDDMSRLVQMIKDQNNRI